MLTGPALRFEATLAAALIAGPALGQSPDPIGPLTRTQTFDRALKIDVGRSQTGKTVCYFREQGSSHSLDIGVSAAGAFIRLESFDTREMTLAPPLRVFAGKEILRR